MIATATTAAVAYDHYRRSKGQPSVVEECKAFLSDALKVGRGGDDDEKHEPLQSTPAFASLSLASVSLASTTAGASDSLESAVEPKTGLRFPKKVLVPNLLVQCDEMSALICAGVSVVFVCITDIIEDLFLGREA